MLELDCGLEFDAARAEADFFPALPPHAAVCLIEPREEKAERFLIRTQNLQRRLQRLLGPIDPASKRLNLSDFASGIRYRLTGSPFEQTLTYYQHAKHLFPKRYRDLLRLRPAAVLPPAARTMARSRRAAPPRHSPNAFSTYSKSGTARSKSAAIPRFPAASIPK